MGCRCAALVGPHQHRSNDRGLRAGMGDTGNVVGCGNAAGGDDGELHTARDLCDQINDADALGRSVGGQHR